MEENDFENLYKLYTDPIVVETLENELETDIKKFRKVFLDTLNNGIGFIILLKKNNKFIGFIGIHQYIKKNEINYSQIWTAFLKEYWGKGYCTEVTIKLLHFSFLGIKTPWICANQFHTNPAAAKVLKKCGFSFYKTFKMKKGLYDQYRYIREDYIKYNSININNSPYAKARF